MATNGAAPAAAGNGQANGAGNGAAETYLSLDDAAANWIDPDEDQQADVNGADESADEIPGEVQDEEIPDADGQTGEEEQPGPDEASGGRFASDDAKVRMPDGSWTTVGALRSGSMLQQDYTRSKMALADEKRAFDAERQRIQSLDAQLQQERQTVAFFAQYMLPKRPEAKDFEADPFGYNYALDAYNRQMEAINRLQAEYNGHQERLQHEQSQSEKSYIAEQNQLLRDKAKTMAPELNTQQGFQQFWNDVVQYGNHYGYTADEARQLKDHRHYLILRDAIAYRKLKAKNAQRQPATNATNGQRPVVRQGKAGAPGTVQQQKLAAAKARFNKAPTIQNAIDLIGD